MAADVGLAHLKVAVGIPTRNRHEEMERALKSVLESSFPVHEIIVSEDGDNSYFETFKAKYPTVTFLQGPSQGLCANRKNIIRAAKADALLFLDDDAVLGKNFFEELYKGESKESISNTILSGLELRDAEKLVYPSDVSFLGHQKVPYEKGASLNTCVILSTSFPIKLFEKVNFDDKLKHCYDEVDITYRARLIGYNIRLKEAAINKHFPSPKSRDDYNLAIDASRIYVTLKRYFVCQKKIFLGLAFALVAPVHLLIFSLKKKRPQYFFQTFSRLFKMIF